jgi:hypothetical protein
MQADKATNDDEDELNEELGGVSNATLALVSQMLKLELKKYDEAIARLEAAAANKEMSSRQQQLQ